MLSGTYPNGVYMGNASSSLAGSVVVETVLEKRNIMRRTAISLAAVMVLVGSAWAVASPADERLQDGDRIVFVGDSITGLGSNNPAGFVHLTGLKSNAEKGGLYYECRNTVEIKEQPEHPCGRRGCVTGTAPALTTRVFAIAKRK